MPPRVELESPGVAVRGYGFRRRLGAGACVASLGVVAGGFWLTAGWYVLGGLVGLLVGALLASTSRREPGKYAHRMGYLCVEDGALRVDVAGARFTFAADELGAGWVEEVGEETALVLRTRRDDVIEARLSTLADRRAAERILGALGLDARAVQLTFDAVGRQGRGCATGCLYLALLVGLPWLLAAVVSLVWPASDVMLAIAILFLLVCGIGAAVSLRALGSTEVGVGSDGVRLARFPRRTRFLPFGRLEMLVRVDNVARLIGEGLQLDVTCQGAEHAEELLSKLRAARERWQEAGGGAELGDLDRGERSYPEWRRHLGALLERSTSYRGRALQPDDLWDAVEDPKASPERRIGAALALSGGIGIDERARIRVAAQACAHEPLRIALEQAAEGELEAEALEEAMRAYEVP